LTNTSAKTSRNSQLFEFENPSSTEGASVLQIVLTDHLPLEQTPEAFDIVRVAIAANVLASVRPCALGHGCAGQTRLD
jgi:hypothetical protein